MSVDGSARAFDSPTDDELQRRFATLVGRPASAEELAVYRRSRAHLSLRAPRRLRRRIPTPVVRL